MTGDESASIVEATMATDGTITLRLRAETEGVVGEALFTYARTDPAYESILSHVGDLQPGERKPVSPWPE